MIATDGTSIDIRHWKSYAPWRRLFPLPEHQIRSTSWRRPRADQGPRGRRSDRRRSVARFACPPLARRSGRDGPGPRPLAYRRGHDPHVAVPQAPQRAQRDGPLGALVQHARGDPLPDVREVRVLRDPQRRRPVRLVAAVQVPDRRSGRGAVPGRCPDPRHPDLRPRPRPVHGLVRRPGLRGGGWRRPAVRAGRVRADRGGAEPRLLRGPRRSTRCHHRGGLRRRGPSSRSRVHARARSSPR